MIKSKLVLKDIYIRRAEDIIKQEKKVAEDLVKQEKKVVANAKRKATIAAKSPEVLAAEKFKRDENRWVKEALKWGDEPNEYVSDKFVSDIITTLYSNNHRIRCYSFILDNICHKVDFAVWGLDNRPEYEYILQQRKEIIETAKRLKEEKESRAAIEWEENRQWEMANRSDNDHGWW